MKHYKRRGKNIINQMNVVPYIDVMLVLLVIFMVTAPMFVPKVINLPSVGKASQLNQPPIEISIEKDKRYTITQNNKTTSASNVNDAIIQINALLTNKSTPVVVSADKETRYNDVITIVDKLYATGIKKVALVVKEHN